MLYNIIECDSIVAKTRKIESGKSSYIHTSRTCMVKANNVYDEKQKTFVKKYSIYTLL